LISLVRHARVAAFAALLASAGDLILLYVANAQREELGLPQVGRAWLWLGGALGVLFIPLYALGYRAASRLVAPVSSSAAQVLFASGAIAAILGSLIHGLTTAYIGADLEAAVPGRDPLASVVSWGAPLLALWGLAALLVLVASGVFLWCVSRGATRAPRSAALANPALVTVVLSAVGLPSVLLRSFLTPAAPNLAHLVFFSVCAWSLYSGRGSPGGERSGQLSA
jgi:hypothetical protein